MLERFIMDREIVEFRPGKIYKYLFSVLAGMILAFQYIFFKQSIITVSDMIGYVIITVFSFVALIKTFNMKRLMIRFKEDKIEVISHKKIVSSIFYRSLSFAYFCSDRQGYKKVLLSQNPLDKKSVQKIINKKTFYLNEQQEFLLVLSIHNAARSEVDCIVRIIERNIFNVIKM